MNYKSIKSELKYIVILFALYSFFLVPITSVRATSPNRYHAGYYGLNNPDGIRGDILTIDSSVIYDEFFAEWVCVIISYSPHYWVQLGYFQHWSWWIFPPFPYIRLDFYFERMHAVWPYRSLSYSWLRPLVGHTYTYEIKYKVIDLNMWHYKILEGQNFIFGGDIASLPSTHVQLQALVETTHTSIRIDGSHFTNLKYFNDPNWYLWSVSYPVSTPPGSPYSVQYEFPYEFYANGGG